MNLRLACLSVALVATGHLFAVGQACASRAAAGRVPLSADFLTDPRTPALHGSLSPNGKWVVFTRKSPQEQVLCLRRLEGPDKELRLTRPSMEADFGRWSPDGKQIYFHGRSTGPNKIFRLDLATRKIEQVTFGSSDDFHPAPSPNGRFLAFDGNESGNYDLWIQDLRTGKKIRITDSPAQDFYPSWSPDGRQLAFTSSRAEGFHVWIKRLGKGSPAPERLTRGKGIHAHPAWSPDGRYVAFDADQDGQVKIWMHEVATGRLLPLTELIAHEEYPAWRPDGKGLTYTAKENELQGIRVAALPDLARAGLPIAQAGRVADGKDLLAPLPGEGEGLPGPAFTTTGLPAGQDPTVIPDGDALGELIARTGGLAFSGGSGTGETAATDPARGATGRAASTESAGASAFSPSAIPPAAPSFEAPGAGTDSLEGPSASRTASSPGRGNTVGGGLKVIQFHPKDRPEGVKPGEPIAVVFAEALESGLPFDKLVLFEVDGRPVEAMVAYNPNLRRIDVVSRRRLLPGQRCRVRIGAAVRSTSGTSLGEEFGWTFVVGRGDAKPIVRIGQDVQERPKDFRIAAVRPAAEDRQVALDTNVVCRLTHPVDPATLGPQAIRLFRGSVQLPGEVFFPPRNDTLVLTPYEKLESGKTYRVEIAPHLKNDLGSSLQGKTGWTFSTGFSTPLQITAIKPEDKVIAGRSTIVVAFNRPIDPESLGSGKVFLRGEKLSYGGNVIVATDGKSLLFQPYQKVPNARTYTLLFPPGLADGDGNGLEQSEPIVFTSRYEEGGENSAAASILARHKRSGEIKSPGSYMQSSDRGLAIRPGTPTYGHLLALQRKGYLGRDLEGDLRAKAPLTRYKCALLVESAMKCLSLMGKDDVRRVQRLARDFEHELRSLGIQTGEMSSLIRARERRAT